MLAPLPAPPKAIGELMRWPALLEAYLRDSFPYRSELVSLNNRTRWVGHGDSPNREVVRGDTGRLFLGPVVSDFHYYSILTLCGVGVPEAWKQKVADRYSEAIARFTQKFNDAWVFIVPTSPTIYRDELPSWAAAQCKNTIPLVSKILERVPDKLRHYIVYPAEEIATLSRTAEVFLKLNFHWAGRGPQPIVEMMAEKYLYKRKHLAVPAHGIHPLRSEFTGFIPGVELKQDILKSNFEIVPDLTICNQWETSDCFLHQTEVLGLLANVQFVQRSGPNGGKLLLIADSFKLAASPFFC